MDQVCPRCKTTKYRNPNMKLMVNVCGHNICESCVELLFVKGSGACPECNIPLRRTNFRLQLFEDASIDKEVDIRRRILKDFNKHEEDFETLREFNDYLEMVEDIIFNLTNNLDILETNKKIQSYKENNKEVTVKNRSKQSKDSLEIGDILAMEQKQSKQIKLEMKVLEEAEKVAKIKNKEKLIDDLMFGDKNASKILEEHRVTVAREEKSKMPFSTGLETGGALPVPVAATDEMYVYSAPVVDVEGPLPPLQEDLHQAGFTHHIKTANSQERAGGYEETMGCYRAVQEAMAGLYFVPGAGAGKVE
eukprot:GFUD01032726.1.p1 GENE.GFUD01032726.1~~GFUD01032726.1.p1  ORF type:complete len:306 (+),score=127.81 GFUD01032726.1:44-961(+)